ncbi:DUF1156 domain-containing protein [Streptomyces sp. XHT-2]|nr:DUF1156 domain-containing protein [Streptomyces sp. XHT-2]
MTRMIERWFPCAEVSEAAGAGWGHGKVEKTLFPWFAARPVAQAKAAVITSLLPWPQDEAEQLRLQGLVRRAMKGRYSAWDELCAEIEKANPGGAKVLDPFSGRGMIPLEAARLAIPAFAVDYSPVAVLASSLLVDFPFRDWSHEPQLPFGKETMLPLDGQRLVQDLDMVLTEIGHRLEDAMGDFYAAVDSVRPWAYLWSVTLPCQECGNRFPLVGSLELRKASKKRQKGTGVRLDDPGQSFYIDADSVTGKYEVVVHDGPPRRTPTLTNATDKSGRKIAGKSAVCPFCSHVHPLDVHRRLTNAGQGQDALLVVADLDDSVGKYYREAMAEELDAAARAAIALQNEPPFSPFLPAVPDEEIAPGNNNIIGPSIYGARTYGDLMCARQTLSFVRLCRIIGQVADELLSHGLSIDYVRALSGYAASVMVRKIRRSTRGAVLDVKVQAAHDIYSNQGSITFSYDFLETGLGGGQGTWQSLSSGTVSTLRGLSADRRGVPTQVERGTATALLLRDSSVDAVVTDPPYDQMIAYADSSDISFSWMKRALFATWPDLMSTNDPMGVQEKTEEIIVKRVRGEAPDEHRTRAHYDSKIAQAFKEMRRVVSDQGIVTIVFGHGEPEVWDRLLTAISQAGLIMTGSWPASTESGSHQGKANISTTLTMACRPAPASRPDGRKAAVEAEVKAEVRSRVLLWEKSGLAPTDMLMAAAGPAMEVVGRYGKVLDARAEPVDISTFLPLARQAVQEAMAVEIDQHPLEVFDARTRFALWWVRVYGRQVTAKSELRWQALAASMSLSEVRDLVPDADKGCRFVASNSFKSHIDTESSVIDVVLAMAKASEDGLAAVGEVLVASGRDPDDAYPWAAMKFLADRLPDSDADAIAWTRILRNRTGVGSATRTAAQAKISEAKRRNAAGEQLELG